MGEYIVKKETLTAICDSIREKLSSSLSMSPSEATDTLNNLEKIIIEQFISGGGISHIENNSIRKIRSWGLYAKTNLISVSFPKVTEVHDNAFYGSTLRSADFSELTTIMYRSFYRSALITLILRNSDVCTLTDASAFTSTPIASGTGYIYVPRSLVDSYKSASNWSTYASQIRAIEDYPEICNVSSM